MLNTESHYYKKTDNKKWVISNTKRPSQRLQKIVNGGI